MTRHRPARAAAVPLALALALGACGGGEDSSASGATSTPAASAEEPETSPGEAPDPGPGEPSPSPSPSPSPEPASSGPDGEDVAEGGGDGTPETVPTALDTDVFSGYDDVERGVRSWLVRCPRDLAPDALGEVPTSAVAMGTASQVLDAEGVIARSGRQVAVFASVDEAVVAADALGAYVRSCDREYEPMPGFVARTQTVSTAPVGTQGVQVDAVREDGDDTFVAFRRGTAVGLVQSSGIDFPEGRSAGGDATAGARALFRQMCTYEQGAC